MKFRIFDWAGNILLILACVVIVAGYTAIIVSSGWGKLWEILSPFNIWNWLAIIVILLPGLVFKILANKVKDKASIKQ